MAPKKDTKKKLQPGDADKGSDFIRAQELDRLATLLDEMNVKAINKHEIKGGRNMLHVAVEEENETAVAMLLDYGAKVNFRTKTGETALMLAVYYGNKTIFDMLIQSGADITIKDSKNGTPLHIAAHRGKETMAECVIFEYKSIVAEQDEKKKKAAEEAERRLLAGSDNEDEEEDEEGGAADVPGDLAASSSSVLDASTKSPSASAVLSEQPSQATEVTEDTAAAPAEGEEVKEEAEEEDEEEKKGVERDEIDLMKELEHKDEAQESPLAVACKMQWFDIATLLVENGCDPNTRCVNDNTPLTRSAFDGRLETAKWLTTYCKRPVDLAAKTINGESSILIAIKQRNFKLASLLLEKGADIDDTDSQGNTGLIFGAMACSMDIVKYCIEKKGFIDAQNKWGMTALMYVARNTKGGLILDYLINERSADVNQVDRNYNNALMHACKKGCMTSATKLLAAGADWLQEDDHGVIARDLVKPYSKDPERNKKMYSDALQVHMSVETKPCKYGESIKPAWMTRQIQEEKDEKFRIAENAYFTQVLEEEAEMKKQEEKEKWRSENEELARIEAEKKAKAEFDALPQKEKDKILRKQAKERAEARRKAEEEANAGGAAAPGAGLAVDTSAAERKSTTPSDSSKDFKEGKSPKGGNKKSSKK
jgi:ankyrin repeat protein